MKKFNLKIVFDFLTELRLNNNREWFNENRSIYQDAKKEYECFIDQLIPKIKEIDSSIDINSAKECMFRIFKDVRFSKNKLPYKTNFGAVITQGGRKSPFAGYYVHFEPDNSFLGGGIYMPQSNFLKMIRKEIFENTDEFKKIINSIIFKETFGELMGDKLKTAPRGFPKDFKDISLLNHKHYAVGHELENSFWLQPKLIERIIDVFKVQFNLNQYLNKAIQKAIIESNKTRVNIQNEENFIKNNFSM